jgi:hypothetical protein
LNEPAFDQVAPLSVEVRMMFSSTLSFLPLEDVRFHVLGCTHSEHPVRDVETEPSRQSRGFESAIPRLW